VSDEQRTEDEAEVEAHKRMSHEEPRDEAEGEVEGHVAGKFDAASRLGASSRMANDEGENDEDVEAHGGEINAWTSFDQTVYHIVLASQFARFGLDVLAEGGVRAVVQPGGSKRDDEVVAAADEHGIAMLFTGRRHFRH